MDYLDDEKKLRDAADRFREAFAGINNAVVIKSQKNTFGLYVKYPLSIFLLFALVATMFILQFTLSFFDVLYIISEIILTIGIVFISAVMVRTWVRALGNAKFAEEITYYNHGGVRCMVSRINGGGNKIEWSDASLYVNGDDFELIESASKAYNPIFYKKIHGHSRGYKFFDIDFLIDTFFVGMTVVGDDNGVVTLSSGFKFGIDYGVLKFIEVDGFYDECYENNFPILSIMAQSKSYIFRYEFTAVNVPNFRLILPDRANEGAKLFFLNLPDDKNIIVH